MIAQDEASAQVVAAVAAPAPSAWRGYLYIIGASVLWGIAAATAKVLFNASVSPLDLTAVRSLIAALLFGAVWIAHGRPFRRDQLGFLLLFGVLLSAVNLSFYMAIKLTSVAVALALEYTAPMFVVFYSFARGRAEGIGRSLAIAAAGIAGCYLLVGAYRAELLEQNAGGIVAGLVCGVSFAAYSVLGERGHRMGIDTLSMTFGSFAISAILWLALSHESVQLLADPKALPLVLFIGVFATVVPYFIYLEGLKHVPSFQATVLGMLDPLVAWLSAALLLGEMLEGLQVLGMMIVLSTIIVMKRTGRS